MIPFSVIFNEPAWAELDPHEVTEASIKGVALLKNGMESGRPSVAFRIDLPDGDVVIAQTSARLFCVAAKAIMARHPELFEGDE
jgi:hypothetical protein